MSYPFPDPPQIPQPAPVPRFYSVPLKSCCGLLEGDWCDCAEFFAEMVASMRSPLRISWTHDRGVVEVTR